MIILLTLSTILTLLVVLPRAVYSRIARDLCGVCQYDLTGLPKPGICPECGGHYTTTQVKRTHWVWRWDLAPQVIAAMLLPALAPALPVLTLAYAYYRMYPWGWDGAFYQASERDLGINLLFCFPFLANGWSLIGGSVARVHQEQGAESSASSDPTLELVKRAAMRARFWPALAWSTGLGLAATAMFGWAAWRARFTDNAGFFFVLGVLMLLGGIWLGRIIEAMTRPRGEAGDDFSGLVGGQRSGEARRTREGEERTLPSQGDQPLG
jgi:hypothetical protein